MSVDVAELVCLDALSDRSRRARPMEEGPQQRVRWFSRGFETDDVDRCDTFAAASL
ncbi:MAG: neutral zinc metallopeptidase [Candidatus Binatia bacterium]